MRISYAAIIQKADSADFGQLSMNKAVFALGCGRKGKLGGGGGILQQ